MKCQIRTVHQRPSHVLRASRAAKKSLIKCSAAKAPSLKAWRRSVLRSRATRLCRARVSILKARVVCSNSSQMTASLAHLDLPRQHFTLSTCQSLPNNKPWRRYPCRLLSLCRATLRRLKKLEIFHLGSAAPKPKEKSSSSIVRIKRVCRKNEEIRQHASSLLLMDTVIQRKRPRRTRRKIWTK